MLQCTRFAFKHYTMVSPCRESSEELIVIRCIRFYCVKISVDLIMKLVSSFNPVTWSIWITFPILHKKKILKKKAHRRPNVLSRLYPPKSLELINMGSENSYQKKTLASVEWSSLSSFPIGHSCEERVDTSKELYSVSRYLKNLENSRN